MKGTGAMEAVAASIPLIKPFPKVKFSGHLQKVFWAADGSNNTRISWCTLILWVEMFNNLSHYFNLHIGLSLLASECPVSVCQMLSFALIKPFPKVKFSGRLQKVFWAADGGNNTRISWCTLISWVKMFNTLYHYFNLHIGLSLLAYLCPVSVCHTLSIPLIKPFPKVNFSGHLQKVLWAADGS